MVDVIKCCHPLACSLSQGHTMGPSIGHKSVGNHHELRSGTPRRHRTPSSIGQPDAIGRINPCPPKRQHGSHPLAPSGSVTSTKAAAYLLRLQALHARHYRYTATYDYLPGPLNTMADDCSHLWHLSDLDLLSHFHSYYPQAGGWKLCHLPNETTSALISALRQQRLAPESYLHERSQPTDTGHYGPHSAATSSSTHSYPTPPLNQSTYSASSPSTTGMEALLPVANRYRLAQWKTPSAQWARRWPYWGPQILGSPL